MFDNLTFKNKRQRIQVAISLFTIVFFDYQLYLLFNIRVKLDESNDLDVSINDTKIVNAQVIKKIIKDTKIDEDNYVKSNCDNNIVMFIDATYYVNNNFNIS